MAMGECRNNGETYSLSGKCKEFKPKHPLIDEKYTPDHIRYPKVCGNCKYWLLTRL